MGKATGARLQRDPSSADGSRQGLDHGAVVAVLYRDSAHPPAGGDLLTPHLVDGLRRVVDVPIGRGMFDRLTAVRPDVIVVLAVPGFDVVRLCHDLSSSIACPVMVVGDRTADESTVVDALDAGADDFVLGDVSNAVLDARLRVVLRHRPNQSSGPASIEIGDLLIDLRAHSVQISGQPVRCRPVQYILLGALAARANVAVSCDELLSVVWGADPGEVHPRRLRIAVSVLRDILGDGPRRPTIETVSRFGYRLSAPADIGR